MTIKKFGRLTSTQILFLGMIGYKITRQGETLPTHMAKRMTIIRQTRQCLVDLTGQDFGYDLKKWHNYLSKNKIAEYTHPYGYPAVAQAVAATQKDHQFLRIVEHILNAEHSFPPAESKRYIKKAQRLIDKYNQPNPPGLVPATRTDEGLLELWRWAVWWDLKSILAGLALPICALADDLFGKADLQNHLFALAEETSGLACARFLTAAANLESEKDAQINLYKQALTAHKEVGSWGGEAYCAHQLAAIYRYRRQFDEQDQLFMQAFKLWEYHDHQKGMGISLIHLGEILEREGQFKAACKFYCRAKKLLRNHITYITARDILARVSFDHQVAPDDYKSNKSVSELVKMYFDGHNVKICDETAE